MTVRDLQLYVVPNCPIPHGLQHGQCVWSGDYGQRKAVCVALKITPPAWYVHSYTHRCGSNTCCVMEYFFPLYPACSGCPANVQRSICSYISVVVERYVKVICIPGVRFGVIGECRSRCYGEWIIKWREYSKRSWPVKWRFVYGVIQLICFYVPYLPQRAEFTGFYPNVFFVRVRFVRNGRTVDHQSRAGRSIGVNMQARSTVCRLNRECPEEYCTNSDSGKQAPWKRFECTSGSGNAHSERGNESTLHAIAF